MVWGERFRYKEVSFGVRVFINCLTAFKEYYQIKTVTGGDLYHLGSVI